MKKELLIIYSSFLFVVFGITRVNAQNFDLDFYNYFARNLDGAADAKTAFTTWRGSNSESKPGYKVTQDVISAYTIQNNRTNSIGPGNEPDDANPQYIRAQFGHNDCAMVVESTNDLFTIALVYRGSGDTSPGKFQISYGASEAGPLTTKELDEVTATLPGTAVFFNFPKNLAGKTNVKYVKIQRVNGYNNPRLYRITASSIAQFTALPTLPPLPLDFLSFTAKPDAFGKSVSLNWQTTNEVNTKEFIIERRTDNTEFVSIGSLPSKNVAGVLNYSFVDNTTVYGNVYYRLKQVDNDAIFKYSEIRKVNISEEVSFSVYPNPTDDVLNISHLPAINASVKVLSLDGRTVVSQDINNNATLTSLNVTGLSSGTYVLIYDNEGQHSALKFVKR